VASAFAAVALSGGAQVGLGGTGLGNEFEHYVNRAFDFHVAVPPDWACDGCSAGEREKRRSPAEETWGIAAPEGTTWLRSSFLSDFPAASEAELKAVIESEHPDVEWHGFDRGGFVGFTSSPQGDAARGALEYYLIDKRQALRLEWSKDPALPSRAVELDYVKRSIDRASAPPAVTAVTSEREAGATYAVGEVACLLVEVDDLRAAFDAQSLGAIEIQGAPAHWSFKDVVWVPEKSWFRVCWKVSSAFGADGLLVRQLSIEDSDAGRSVACEADTDDPVLLSCRRYPSESAAPRVERVRQRVAKIDNAAPDVAGPDFGAVAADVATGTLILTATDASGIAAGEVYLNGTRIAVYADDLARTGRVDVKAAIRGGWNTVSKIILYDANGLPTLLEAPKEGTTYTVRPWKGAPRPSSIPVVSFLKERLPQSAGGTTP
jgi:hypothetical protein